MENTRKMIAVKDGQVIHIVSAEACFYIPAGWTEPYSAYGIGDWNFKNPHLESARHLKPMVCSPKISRDLPANQCRIVPDNIVTEINSIDEQIKQLQIKRQELVRNEFLTFPLVTPFDISLDTEHKRYTTKAKAEKNFRKGEGR